MYWLARISPSEQLAVLLLTLLVLFLVQVLADIGKVPGVRELAVFKELQL